MTHYFIDSGAFHSKVFLYFQALVMSLNGNPVRIGNGPAAVTEYENRIEPLSRLLSDGKVR